MAEPNAFQVHLDSILTNVSVAYLQKPNNFIAPLVFPVMPVDKQSDKYYVYTKGAWFRDEAEIRGTATESKGTGYELSKTPYSCDVFALHRDIDQKIAANADSPIDLYRDATNLLTQRMMLRLEKQWTTDYFTTSIWDTDLTPTNKWSDYLLSDPISDIETAKRTILVNTGMMPNTFVLGFDVFNKLKHHPDIVDRIKYTSSQTVTADMLARIFELERVLVSHAVINTGKKGAADSFSFVAGKNALLCYSAPNPGLLAASAGYTFVWRGVSGGLGANVGISRIPMPHLKADRVEAEMAFDNKVISTDLGYFFNAAVV